MVNPAISSRRQVGTTAAITAIADPAFSEAWSSGPVPVDRVLVDNDLDIPGAGSVTVDAAPGSPLADVVIGDDLSGSPLVISLPYDVSSVSLSVGSVVDASFSVAAILGDLDTYKKFIMLVIHS